MTADGDGQHTPEDVRNCADAMLKEHDKVIIGARNFDLPNVPARSRKGNKITSRVFKIFVGMRIGDTQTGLRAIPTRYLESFIRVPGDRYEYETNMLLYMAKHKIRLRKFPLKPFILMRTPPLISDHEDSVRIYSLIIRMLWVLSF